MHTLRRRLAALGVIAGLIAAAQIVAVAPAHADPGHEYCAPPGGLGDFHHNENRWLRVFRFTSATPDILVPKQTITNINPAETYSNVTFTVTQAKAESVSTTLTFSSQTEFKLFKGAITERASATYARQTTDTTTTTVGTTIALSLPPQGRAEIDYGIFVLDVSFTMTVYYNNEKDSSGFCSGDAERFHRRTVVGRLVVRLVPADQRQPVPPATGCGISDGESAGGQSWRSPAPPTALPMERSPDTPSSCATRRPSGRHSPTPPGPGPLSLHNAQSTPPLTHSPASSAPPSPSPDTPTIAAVPPASGTAALAVGRHLAMTAGRDGRSGDGRC